MLVNRHAGFGVTEQRGVAALAQTWPMTKRLSAPSRERRPLSGADALWMANIGQGFPALADRLVVPPLRPGVHTIYDIGMMQVCECADRQALVWVGTSRSTNRPQNTAMTFIAFNFSDHTRGDRFACALILLECSSARRTRP